MSVVNRALVYSVYGDPQTVLSLQEQDLPGLQASQVLVKRLASVIHPSDFGKIQGTYGRLSQLPTVAGREGMGEICELGSAVKGLKLGQRVFIPENNGTWQDYCVTEVEGLVNVPSSLAIDQAAQAFINPPTALRLLNDFVPLRAGDWIIQNAASSCVGRCVIQLANYYGYRTLNVVRYASQIEELKALGATCVLLQSQVKDCLDLTDGCRPKLALNSIGGPSAIELIKTLDVNGVIVTFGAMTGEKVRFPTRELIFKNIQLRGFWMDQWMRTHSELEKKSCLNHVFELMQRKKLILPVSHTYDLSQWKEALRASQFEAKAGKVLFV